MTRPTVLNWPGKFVPTSPISAGWRVREVLVLSGQIPRDLDTGAIAAPDIKTQTTQVIDNLARMLKQHELGLSDVIRCTVYLTDRENFNEFNHTYGKRFAPPYPARTTLITGLVNPDYLIELDAVIGIP